MANIKITDPTLQLYFIGDLHGQFEDLLQIIEIINSQDQTKPKQFLFLGDMVDRGYRSMETILLILTLQLLWPKRVTILRGNHETEKISRDYGFFDECKRKSSQAIYIHFLQLFQVLPIACLITYEEDISDSRKFSESEQSVLLLSKQSTQKLLMSDYVAQKPIQAQDQPKSDHPSYFFDRIEPSQQESKAQVFQKSMTFQMHEGFKPSVQFEFHEFTQLEFCNKSKNQYPNFGNNPSDSIYCQEPSVSTSSITQFHQKNYKILAMHGGLSPKLTNLDQIDLEFRMQNDFNDGISCDLLWADPDNKTDEFQPNNRGVSYLFGAQAAKRFMEHNSIDLIIRAHQMIDGVQKQLKDQVVTVWSASNYEQRMGNKGGILMLEAGLVYARVYKKKYYEEKPTLLQVDYFL